ncbi:beta-ketoacyl-ACP synthase III [Leuconostoc mesenteroides]|uniref:beta-ketoacyl-ACP synthase III n=1 Tax=Leuconostoc mesenteroides TaxID=1245 RepID=UPI0009FD779B|nr:beta-ketoacyl-ACP synthase III [Leuconostoc mesenteroides]MBZ1516833.1 ketoacyl-ACP synthase III [Leuconostoc mesenteroides]MBZ1540746.1 ketoacyl-ACP synthase III [Leuconostoc mesenteroides]MCP9302376.1 ketoacyl-ACP synthase III [Leuconostoc mesenteroides]MCP9326127.1 ketoacyl-ACP synthase III [Leuconostoc mesenteroides]ORI80277.1 3-oxoacyl-ACP synthase [Leuconostoc mesenteroides subsp. mesenteroides]
MEQLKIVASARQIPDRQVTNQELSTMMETDDEWIYTRTGIHQRNVVTTENTSDLASEVAKKILAKSGVSPDSIDFIIVSTMSPDSLSPSTAAIVQANIGATNAFAFDLSAACSGFVYGLSVASSLLMSRYQRGLIIGAEVLSKLVDWKDRTTAVLFGDGAAGVLVERTQDNVGLLGEELRTFGEKGDNLVSGRFANTNPFSENISPLDPYFHQNGREVYSFATREVPEALQAALETAQVTADDVDYYLLHQANARIVSSIAKRFGQPVSKFPTNMASNGNTSAASIGILLDELIESNTIHAGQTIAFAGFGGGLTVGAQIWKI